MTHCLVYSLEELSVVGQGGLPICERIPRIVEAMVYRGYRLDQIELNAHWYAKLEAELSGPHHKRPHEGMVILGKEYVPRLVHGPLPNVFWFSSVLGGEAAIVRSDE